MTVAALHEFVRQTLEQEMAARRYTEPSRKSVRLAVREFLRWASRRSTPDLRQFSKKDLVSFHSWQARQLSKTSGQKLSPSTLASRFATVRLIFSCLYRAGVIAQNPAHGLELPHRSREQAKRRALTREELTEFLEQLDTTSDLGRRDRALFELIYSSGLRVSEAAGLKVGDIDFERRQMQVRGKFDRDRMVPLSQVAADILKVYLGDRAENIQAWVFPGARGEKPLASQSISERFRILLRRFDMDKKEISTHSIRHSTATHLLENGASVRHVQELLGHASIESTVRYTHVMSESLAKIHRRYHPRERELFEVLDEDYQNRLEELKLRG